MLAHVSYLLFDINFSISVDISLLQFSYNAIVFGTITRFSEESSYCCRKSQSKSIMMYNRRSLTTPNLHMETVNYKPKKLKVNYTEIKRRYMNED